MHICIACPKENIKDRRGWGAGRVASLPHSSEIDFRAMW
jgi:hypothetical protein